MIPADSHVFTSPVRIVQRTDYRLMEEYNEGKWPIWVRLVTIIGLSTGLWAAIIWAAVSIFG
jgi:hypothetical protein